MDSLDVPNNVTTTSPEVQINEVDNRFSGISLMCDEPFWNHSRAWESSTPEFGPCVERTVLVWIPCGFLWLFAPFYFLLLRRSPYNPIPWTALSYTKLLLSLILMISGLTEFIWVAWQGPTNLPPVDIVASVILMITYIIHIALICICRQRGARTSGLLWIFWLIMFLCGIPQLITSVTSVVYMNGELPFFLVITFIVQYSIYILLFISNWFCDAPSKLQLLTMSNKPSRELSASAPSQFMFWWCFSIIWLGWKRPLVFDDLWDVKQTYDAGVISEEWHADFKSEPKSSKLSYDTGKEYGKKKVYLYERLWRMCWRRFILIGVFYLTSDMVRFIAPQLLSLLIKFTTNTNEPSWHGYLYAISLFTVCEVALILKNRYIFLGQTLSFKIQTAIMSAVYRKALKLSGSARRESTLGHIVNMMAVDAQVVGDACWLLLNVFVAPIVVLVAMGFLWAKLGPSVLSGLTVLILTIPGNSYLINRIKEYELICIKLRDERVKMVNEVVSSIKVLKLYGWEESFAKKIQAVRDKEVSHFRIKSLLQCFADIFYFLLSYFVTLTTFTTYLLVSKDNVLDAELAFVSISLFNIMKPPIAQMPWTIAQLIQANVALGKIKTFLSGGELDLMAVSSDRSEEYHLMIHKGQFSWQGADGLPSWTLRDVEMNIKPGKLVAVVGPVGAGKSSLISALLGEITKETGRVVVNGSVAYVSQQAWLQNATMRDNITWGQPYEGKWYHTVIEACALLPDLEMLEGGDMTEVGEKGINLSGGQKQRISLARAVYRDADVVLLDDPLSAVDAHVGKHIFDKVIGPEGLLKSKTRLLVTHAVTFLPQVDEVIMIKDGLFVESGSYSELVAADGDFAQLIVQYITSCDDDAVDEELLELRGQLEGASREEILLQLSQISSSLSHSASTGKDSKHDGRQRSISETQDVPKLLNQSTSYSQLYQSNDIIGNGSQHDCNSKLSLQGSCKDQKVNRTISKNEAGGANSAETHKLIDEEIQETGKVARYVYAEYGKAIGMAYILFAIISLSLGQASIAGSNVWLSLWSTSGNSGLNGTLLNVTAVDSDFSLVVPDKSGTISRDGFLAGYGIFGVAQALFMFIGLILVEFGTLRAANTLHQSLLSTIVRLPMSFFDTNPSGRIINRFSKEISTLDFKLPYNIRFLLISLTQVVATLVVIMASTPVAAVAIIPIMVMYYLIQVVFVATSRQIKRIESVSKSPIYSHFSESIQGVSVIRAFKRQDEFIQESLSTINRSLKPGILNVTTVRWVAVHLETLGNLMIFSAAMLAVLGRETISPGIVGLSITYALTVTQVFQWLVRVASELEANIVSVERINEYIQKEQEAKWVIQDQAPSSSWPEDGSISFKNYETRYRPGLDLVLKGITCSFKPAEKVGIVGRTGAGKSSLTLALFRLIESTGGTIEIDGINISNLGLHDLRSRISIIPQDPVLFSGTLRMNLDPFETRSDADVWGALELAHLKDYVKSQPLRLQHVVDEDGSNFSVGQRQLVCLSRALLRQSRILVLDEATAAIDLETDDLIQATIRDQFRDCTVLTIAHRINTIMDYDRVLVLDQGRIAEFDAPSALLENSHSIFYGMAKDAGLVQ